jgi:hypothetical protein
LAEQGIAYRTGLSATLSPGVVYFVPATGEGVVHKDFVTQAWVSFPMTAVLSRVTGLDGKIMLSQ